MAFLATEFVFDGVPSSAYGLFIGNTGRGNASSSGISFNMTMDMSGSGTKQLLLGVKYDAPLTFNLDVFSFEPMDNLHISKVQNWLCGRNTYKKLQIVQDDLSSVYFNCIIGKPNITYVGNMARMISFQVTCDAPWAYELPKEIVKNTSTWSFRNTSDHWDWLIPNFVEITCSGGDLKIVNVTDGRETVLLNRKSGEIITMSETTGVVKSSSGLRLMDDFNKNFIRFVSGNNDFVMQNVSQIKINYNLIRKVVG